MPELPEVETIRNMLRRGGEDHPSLLGMTITGSEVYWERTLAMPGVDEFRRRITGQVVQEIGRRGKHLLFDLSHDTLIFHLRMSGDLYVEPDVEPVATHHRLVIKLQDGLRLAFNDFRKFGRVWLVSDPQEVLSHLGPEPLDPGLTPKQFYQRLQAHRRQLKPLLLDQTFLAGLGNIYTDEVLNLAHLHPLMLSSHLTPNQSEILLESIRVTLQEGIRCQGTSIDWVYRGGDYQQHLRVYQRTGLPCPECGTLIERLVVGQRGTHYCPNCQKIVVVGS